MQWVTSKLFHWIYSLPEKISLIISVQLLAGHKNGLTGNLGLGGHGTLGNRRLQVVLPFSLHFKHRPGHNKFMSLEINSAMRKKTTFHYLHGLRELVVSVMSGIISLNPTTSFKLGVILQKWIIVLII